MRSDETRSRWREPVTELERQLIRAYVAGAGHDLQELLARTDAEAHALLTDASRHAVDTLSELEAATRFLHALRGQE